jgi:excisionase family DNA binding protein
MDKLYTVEAAAEVLSVTPDTVRRWLREGSITGVKLPGNRVWRVEETELKSLIDKNRISQPKEEKDND